jgi:hypothetical protein
MPCRHLSPFVPLKHGASRNVNSDEAGATAEDESDPGTGEEPSESVTSSTAGTSGLRAFRRIFKGRKFCPGLFVDMDHAEDCPPTALDSSRSQNHNPPVPSIPAPPYTQSRRPTRVFEMTGATVRRLSAFGESCTTAAGRPLRKLAEALTAAAGLCVSD